MPKCPGGNGGVPRGERGAGLRAAAYVVIVVLAGCSAIGSESHAFATLAEARQAGAIRDGRVPEGLPPGTQELREAHVPGGPQVWGLFNFPPAEGAILRGILHPEELPLESLRCDPPARIEWWPIALRGRLDAEKLGATGLRAYRARHTNLVLAVNWKQGRAYYWFVAP